MSALRYFKQEVVITKVLTKSVVVITKRSPLASVSESWLHNTEAEKGHYFHFTNLPIRNGSRQLKSRRAAM